MLKIQLNKELKGEPYVCYDTMKREYSIYKCIDFTFSSNYRFVSCKTGVLMIFEHNIQLDRGDEHWTKNRFVKTNEIIKIEPE